MQDGSQADGQEPVSHLSLSDLKVTLRNTTSSKRSNRESVNKIRSSRVPQIRSSRAINYVPSLYSKTSNYKRETFLANTSNTLLNDSNSSSKTTKSEYSYTSKTKSTVRSKKSIDNLSIFCEKLKHGITQVPNHHENIKEFFYENLKELEKLTDIVYKDLFFDSQVLTKDTLNLVKDINILEAQFDIAEKKYDAIQLLDLEAPKEKKILNDIEESYQIEYNL